MKEIEKFENLTQFKKDKKDAHDKSNPITCNFIAVKLQFTLITMNVF